MRKRLGAGGRQGSLGSTRGLKGWRKSGFQEKQEVDGEEGEGEREGEGVSAFGLAKRWCSYGYY